MKIAVVTTEYPTSSTPDTGAFAFHNAQALSIFHDVTVIHLVPPASDDGEKDRMDGNVRVRAFQNSMKNLEDVSDAARLVFSLAAGFDMLHTMNVWTSAVMGMDMQGELSLACPWVHSEQWTCETPFGWFEGVAPVEEILLQADGLTVVASKLGEKVAKKRYFKPTATVPFVIPVEIEVVEREYQDGRVRLVSGGSISAKHQPELAVRTVKALRDQGQQASLTWVGSGSYISRALAKATELGVADFVSFIGRGQGPTLEECINESDIFFNPTKEETFFLPAAKALLMGRPVVLGEGGKDLEYLSEDTSAIVEEKNSKAYAKAILALLERTSSASVKDIATTLKADFSYEGVGQAYTDFYEKVITESGWSR